MDDLHPHSVLETHTPRAAGGLLGRLAGLVRGFDRDEGGAVVLLCFAACMLIFMVSLIMFDAGFMARDKIDVQMAADTAAYSQASVKARAMNMTAFANIGKRTIVGIRNMYYFQYPAYYSWYRGQCSACCCGLVCGCWTQCLNCWGNRFSFVPLLEGIDFAMFSLGRLMGDTITDHLEALDAYQASVQEYAGWWALGEAMIRAARNGANMIGSYPLPDDARYGGLPIAKSDNPAESCLTPSPFGNPTTMVTMAEWNANFQELRRRSVSRPPPALQGPAERVRRGLSLAGCAELKYNPLSADAEPASPYFVRNMGDDGRGYMDRSNFIFAYRYNPAYSGYLRDNYTLPREYDTPLNVHPDSGLWTMARGEVYFPPDNMPDEWIGGDHSMWLFHPGWIGKLRPVALPGEDIPVDTSEMWRESSQLARRSALIFGARGAGVFQDLRYMDKATRGLDGKIDGREVLDGIAK